MFANKAKEIIKLSALKPKEKSLGIYSLFWTALAIRKFQKFESEKFKNSIEYKFDKKTAIDELKILFEKNSQFFLTEFLKLCYIIRKFELTFTDLKSIDFLLLPSIYNHLANVQNSLEQNRPNYFLCLCLKYLAYNSNEVPKFFKIEEIMNMIRYYSSHSIKTQLVLLLSYVIEKSNDSILINQLSSDLSTLVFDLPELNQDVKAFFFSKLELHKSKSSGYELTQKSETRKPFKIKTVKKNQQVVTKTIQTVKSKTNSKKSEENEFKLLNLNESIKSRSRNFNSKTTLEPLETVNDKEGDDQSIFNNTWDEAINLYSIALSKQMLKSTDKDDYIPSKFLGRHFFPDSYSGSSRFMYSFFINRMCSSIFSIISRKQKLNETAIDKLMMCIDNFEKFYDKLLYGNSILYTSNKREYVNKFIEAVYMRYWDLKKLQTPQLIIDFSKSMTDLIVEEYIDYGIFYNSTKTRKKNFNWEKVEEIVNNEILTIRLEAVTSLYNSAIRDKKILTKTRMEIIGNYLNTIDDDVYDPKFQEFIIKIIDLADSINEIDPKTIFDKYIELLDPNKIEDNIKIILNFINNQVKDLNRCCQLFNDKTIEKLLNILSNQSVYNIYIKQDILEIVNNYLEHELIKGLSDSNLDRLISYTILSDVDSSLMSSAFVSLLLMVNKPNCRLPISVLSKLLTNFDSNENSNFVLLILGRAIIDKDGLFLTKSEDLELISSKLDSDEVVNVNDGDKKIKFEKVSKDNHYDTSNFVSVISAKIILKSIENKIKLSMKTIDNLILILNSTNEYDKQTKIIAAKCLYYADKYMSIDNLNILYEIINSDIYDVSVYIQSAYLHGCARVAFSTDKKLERVHLENISSFYASESLKLGSNDFANEINQYFFQILLYESRKQKFNDENLFDLFDYLLMLNQKYVIQIVEILLVYTNNFTIPEKTIEALENILGLPEYFKRVILIMQNVISLGQMVSNKTIRILVDNIYNSINSRLRYYSFKILEKVIQNQDVNEDVFDKYELTKAGFALHKPNISFSEKYLIIKFIQDKTDNGVKLPLDTKLELEKQIHVDGVLKIFYNISKNKEILSQHLLNILIDKFNPYVVQEIDKDLIYLIGIFEYVAKNDQKLPSQLLEKLEFALKKNNRLEDHVISVFIYLAQKGEILSEQVIDKILDRLLNENNIIIKQELLSSLGSLIEANKSKVGSFKNKIHTILINNFDLDNFNIHKLCVKIVRVFAYISKIDNSLLEKLVQIGINSNCDSVIRNEIFILFNTYDQNGNLLLTNKETYLNKIRLANLNYKSNEDLLDKLNNYVEISDGFLDQNYKQLKNLIDNENNNILQIKALNLLNQTKEKNKISDELLESVALLYESTVSDDIHKACLNLLNRVNNTGKQLSHRVNLIVNEKSIREEYLKSIYQSPVYDELKKNFNLNDSLIRQLFDTLKLKNPKIKIENFSDFVELMIKENQLYYENPIFVLIIEKCLSMNKLTHIALPCYSRIIKHDKAQNVENSLEKLSERTLNSSVSLELLNAIYEAIKMNIRVADVCVELLVKSLINNEDIKRIISFKALCITLKDDRYPDTLLKSFILWCRKSFEILRKQTGVEIKNLNILETVLSIEFVNTDVFKSKPKILWMRELLVSNLFEHFKVNKSEQFDFYSNWLIIEKKFGIEKSDQILAILEPKHFDSFNQINELITIIIDIDTYENIISLLNVDNISIYSSIKQESCLKKFNKYLSNQKMEINRTYLISLVEKLSSKLEYSFIKKLLKCLDNIDNLREFENLIDFCFKEKIKTFDLKFHNVKLKDLRMLLEVKCLSKNIKAGNDELFLSNLLLSLLNKDWTFEQLKILVNSSLKSKNMITFLNTINQYNISSYSNFHKCKQILAETETFVESMRKLNTLVIENNFQLEGKVKDVNELLAELNSGSNLTNSSLIKYINTDLRTHLELVKSDDLTSEIYTQTKQPIAKWNEKQIYLWSKERSKMKNLKDYEAIAVIKQANYIETGHTLTDTQILCSLIALKNENKMLKGKLLEVATGEGKSTIVCILAIINALKGYKVDVITSSPVLAERDAKQKAKLFNMFNLTCSDNNDKTIYLKGAKECYKADIVYGEVSQFQFDILRDNYSQLETLGSRKCEIAIVDEVDSMLIDDSSKIARLSSTVAGMDHFHAMYVFIWQRLVSIQQKFFTFNKKTYFVEGKIEFEYDKITLEFIDENDENNLKKVDDLEALILKFSDEKLNQFGIEYVGDNIEEYLRKSLERFLQIQIKESNLLIPENFQDFFEKQKSKWISNAIEALNYQENIHYVVQDGQIKPVDYYSTGIVQSSTNWSDGLHQFLQLKHNLKMTSETFTTNFLSNIGFVNKYIQVYGLTGTLGSEKARNVLKNVYKVELVNVPQRRQKQYIELEPVVTQDDEKWLNEIIYNSKLEAEIKNRGVLVICETIEHANRINEALKTKMRSSAVKLYTMNNMNQEKNVEKIHPGEVIIATNLAGRGTDIHTSEIEQYGGLHVILTFMPSNQRVEDQAFGRTARQGKRGTGLMILNSTTLPRTQTNTKQVKQMRNEIESNMLDEFENNDLKLIMIKDNLFEKFCNFLNVIIRKDIRKKYNGWFTSSPSIYETNILAAIEEQWAMFLSKLDDREIKLEQAQDEYSNLINKLRKDYDDESIIKNSYYYVSIGFEIIKEWSLIRDSPKAKRALEYFEKAVKIKKETKQKSGYISSIKSKAMNLIKSKNGEEKEEFESGAAYLGIAWSLLLIQEDNYKEESLAAFKKALLIMSNEMSVLNTIQMILEQKNPGFVNSDLYKQLNIKASILGSYLNSIQSCIDAIKRSLRLIDIEIIKKNKSGTELIELISEQRKSNEIKSIFKKDALHTVSFNSMTTRTDSGERDQAIETIDLVFNKSCLNSSSYQNICVKIKQVDLERVNSVLFDVDKEFKDLTKESAINKLKEERSFFNFMRLTNSYLVDLNIYSIVGDTKEEHCNKQMNSLIYLIEEKTDENLRFNIKIKNSNDNFIDSDTKFKINIDLDNLDDKNLISKLDSIKADFVHIETTMNKKCLIEVINDNKLNSAIVCVNLDENEKRVYERLNREKLKEHVEKLEHDHTACYVKFENLKLGDAKFLVEHCPKEPQLLYSASFINIDNSSIKKLDGQVNLCFDSLNKMSAKKIIPLIRKANFEFCLEFKSLSKDQAEYLILNSSLEQEKIQINKVKKLSELFMKNALPILELSEFAAKGIDDLIEISEKAFVPWRSVITVAIIGASQVILGGILICTGFGSTVGMALVTEGLADMFTAYRAYSSRQFSWSDYAKQKAISMAISMASLGFSKLKDAAKGAQTFVSGAGKEIAQEVGREVAEQAGSKILTNASKFAGTVAKTGSNLKSLAFKYVGVKSCEAVVREGLNAGVKILSDFAFDSFKPQISESIQLRTESAFISNHELMRLLRKMYAIDLATNSNQLQSRVEQIVQEAINPNNSFAMQQWNSVGLPLLKGVLGSSEKYGSSISMAFRIIGTLNGLKEIGILLGHVVDILVVKLRMADQNSMTINLILHRNLKIKNKESALAISNKLKELKILNEFDNLNIPSTNTDFKCSNLENRIKELEANKVIILSTLDGTTQEELNKSVGFIKEFYEKYSHIDLNSFSMVMKPVADKITDQLIRVADSTLVQPWSTLATSKLTDTISKRIQHNYLVNKDENSDSHNKDQKKYDDLKNKKEPLTDDEKKFMEKYGEFRTLGEQINYNAKDYTIAYCQFEMNHYASKSAENGNKSEPVDKNSEKMAKNVRDGGPANISEMKATAAINGINLIVVTDKSEIDLNNLPEGTEVVYFKQGEDNNIGHVEYFDKKSGAFLDPQSSGYDCFYASFSRILANNGIEKSTSDLRSETAQHIEDNSKNFSMAAEAAKWIQERYPAEANTLLFNAGYYENEKGEIECEDSDLRGLRKAITDGKEDKTKARGKPYDKGFKDQVPENDQIDPELGPDDEKSLHHILPHNQISNAVLSTLPKDIDKLTESERDEMKAALKFHCNQPGIKEELLILKRCDLPREEEGAAIYASIANNPNNLSDGPSQRSDDPGQKTDIPILKKQNEEYKTAMATAETNVGKLNKLPDRKQPDLNKEDENLIKDNDTQSTKFSKVIRSLAQVPKPQTVPYEKSGVKNVEIKENKNSTNSNPTTKPEGNNSTNSNSSTKPEKKVKQVNQYQVKKG